MSKRLMIDSKVLNRDANGNITAIFIYDDNTKDEVEIKKGSIYSIEYMNKYSLNYKTALIKDILYYKPIDSYALVCDASQNKSGYLDLMLIECIREISLIKDGGTTNV